MGISPYNLKIPFSRQLFLDSERRIPDDAAGRGAVVEGITVLRVRVSSSIDGK
jgi:hypothetical protein